MYFHCLKIDNTSHKCNNSCDTSLLNAFLGTALWQIKLPQVFYFVGRVIIHCAWSLCICLPVKYRLVTREKFFRSLDILLCKFCYPSVLLTTEHHRVAYISYVFLTSNFHANTTLLTWLWFHLLRLISVVHQNFCHQQSAHYFPKMKKVKILLWIVRLLVIINYLHCI